MRNTGRRHHIEGLTVLVLFGVFAACMLTVLLTGAKTYYRLNSRDRLSYDRRTCAQYISARIRQADRVGTVAIEEFDSLPSLTFTDGEGYVTYVYCSDGYIKELYCSDADREWKAGDGEKVLEADGMEMSLDGRLLTVTVIEKDGSRNTVKLCLRSGEGVQL